MKQKKKKMLKINVLLDPPMRSLNDEKKGKKIHAGGKEKKIRGNK